MTRVHVAVVKRPIADTLFIDRSTPHGSDGSIGLTMGTMHRTIDRPLTLRIPQAAPLPRFGIAARGTVRLVFATAVVAIIGGICLGFIVGFAVATAMQVGP